MKKDVNGQLVEIGKRVRRLRESRGYRQDDFAEALKVSGMTVYRIENGMVAMSVLTNQTQQM